MTKYQELFESIDYSNLTPSKQANSYNPTLFALILEQMELTRGNVSKAAEAIGEMTNNPFNKGRAQHYYSVYMRDYPQVRDFIHNGYRIPEEVIIEEPIEELKQPDVTQKFFTIFIEEYSNGEMKLIPHPSEHLSTIEKLGMIEYAREKLRQLIAQQ